jgi:hypothetical protein
VITLVKRPTLPRETVESKLNTAISVAKARLAKLEAMEA